MYKIDQRYVRDNAILNHRSEVAMNRIMREHDTIKSDIYKLRSQLLEVCQQANGTDTNLCSRIKTSITQSNFDYNINSGNNYIDSKQQSRLQSPLQPLTENVVLNNTNSVYRQ
ncbi:HESP115 [Hemileuca sp. nucleopolyhedrovirus]|uniref:HESP115 n=1 Tax=Hemileuca sp. nucleopolyhedrovirus TaxID=1367203 RepID=S5N9D9_9ABAC|nr:HESP115 [Hemileuca sp. nucleopolyhedrovirus]AGR56867.1 HESP115 [Hemileuca sp. nucleopolyhedrovirus]